MTFSSVLLLALVLTQAEEPKSAVETVEVSPARAEAEVGETLSFHAVARDASGKVLDEPVASWFAAPFDVGSADETMEEIA